MVDGMGIELEQKECNGICILWADRKKILNCVFFEEKKWAIYRRKNGQM